MGEATGGKLRSLLGDSFYVAFGSYATQGFALLINLVKSADLAAGIWPLREVVLGLSPFSAPEEFAGARPTPATDIYGLAATLLYWVTGRYPRGGADEREAIQARQTLRERSRHRPRARIHVELEPQLEGRPLRARVVESPPSRRDLHAGLRRVHRLAEHDPLAQADRPAAGGLKIMAVDEKPLDGDQPLFDRKVAFDGGKGGGFDVV